MCVLTRNNFIIQLYVDTHMHTDTQKRCVDADSVGYSVAGVIVWSALALPLLSLVHFTHRGAPKMMMMMV